MKRKINSVRILLITAVSFTLIILCFFGCNEGHNKSRVEFTALDTYITLTTYGKSDKDSILQSTVKKYDKIFSATNSESEIFKLNKLRTLNVSDELKNLINKAVSISKKTDGDFDITVYPLVKAWGFTSGEYKVPTKAELANLLKSVGFENIVINGDKIELLNQTEIDLGGIAKGYIGDKCAEVLIKNGINCGVLSLGGNIRTFGKKPDSSKWAIGVEYPDSNGYFGTLYVDETNIISSGAYQRNFSVDGEFYHHIIDPKTGYPAASDLLLSTVINDDGALADGLSTALYVAGYEKAKKFSLENNINVILLNKKNELWISENLRENFDIEPSYKDIIKLDY